MLEPVLEEALLFLAQRVSTTGAGTPFSVWNTLSWKRKGVVRVCVPLPKGPCHVATPTGRPVPAQQIGLDELLVEVREIPALGHAVYYVQIS